MMGVRCSICLMRFFMVLLCMFVFLACRPKARVVRSDPGGEIFVLSDSPTQSDLCDTLDFGRMREGEKVTKEFRIRNAAHKPLVILAVDSSCGCVLFGYNREPIPSGEEKTMTASFDSNGYWGEVVKKVSLVTSMSSGPHTIIVVASVE